MRLRSRDSDHLGGKVHDGIVVTWHPIAQVASPRCCWLYQTLPAQNGVRVGQRERRGHPGCFQRRNIAGSGPGTRAVDATVLLLKVVAMALKVRGDRLSTC